MTMKNKINCGDIFQVGSHIVACGDARDIAFVNRVIGDRSIKAVICDPPYGAKVVESKAGFSNIKVAKKILNDDITDEPQYAQFTKDWIAPVVPHLEPKNSFYVFNSDLMIFALREGMQQAGVHFSQLLIWIKNHAPIGRKDYLPQFELIAYGWHGRHEFNKAKDKSVLWYPKPNKSPLHPTMKPVGLIRRLIFNATGMGDIIYDPFCGSGTAAVAAEQTKRSSITIERDEEYVQTILDRMEKLFGLKAEYINHEKR
jgi:site-specific DNA-methyltransferase (adenine-specific)